MWKYRKKIVVFPFCFSFYHCSIDWLCLSTISILCKFSWILKFALAYLKYNRMCDTPSIPNYKTFWFFIDICYV
jgi:hypothetical protein